MMKLFTLVIALALFVTNSNGFEGRKLNHVGAGGDCDLTGCANHGGATTGYNLLPGPNDNGPNAAYGGCTQMGSDCMSTLPGTSTGSCKGVIAGVINNAGGSVDTTGQGLVPTDYGAEGSQLRKDIVQAVCAAMWSAAGGSICASDYTSLHSCQECTDNGNPGGQTGCTDPAGGGAAVYCDPGHTCSAGSYTTGADTVVCAGGVCDDATCCDIDCAGTWSNCPADCTGDRTFSETTAVFGGGQTCTALFGGEDGDSQACVGTGSGMGDCCDCDCKKTRMTSGNFQDCPVIE